MKTFELYLLRLKAGEMAQWIKCLPHRYEDMSSVSSTHGKLGAAACVYNPSILQQDGR